METRVSILGHIQRGGNPTVYDRLMAFDFTVIAVDHLLKNSNSNKIAVYKKGEFGLIDIEEVVSNKYQLPKHYLDALNLLD
jgi:6-phosphofructokinase 1